MLVAATRSTMATTIDIAPASRVGISAAAGLKGMRTSFVW